MEPDTPMSQFLYSKCVALERVRTSNGLREVVEEIAELTQQKFIMYGQLTIVVREFDKCVQLELWRSEGSDED